MDSMHRCIVSIGSNTSDRNEKIRHAIDLLKMRLERVSASDIYETPAEGSCSQGTYLNVVVHGHTPHPLQAVETMLKELEREMGRTPDGSARGEIAIDLDLVVWNDQILRPRDFERLYFNRGYRQLLADGAFETK